MYKFLILLLLITLNSLSASQSIKVNDDIGDLNLASKTEVFFDTQANYTYADVSADIFTHNFIPVSSKSVSTGYTSDIIWARFWISNDMDKAFHGKLEIPIPWVNQISLFIKTDGVLTKKELGASMAFTSREVDARTFFVPINIQANKTISIYMKVQGTNSLTLSPHLYSSKSSSHRLTNMAMFSGILIGVIIIMFLYNLNMYLTLKENNYLYYILYLIGVIFFMGTYYGFNFQLLWKNSPNFNESISSFIVAFSFFTALLFNKNFLKLDEYSAITNKVSSWMMYIFLVFGIYSLFMDDKLTIVYASIALIIFSSIALIFSSIIAINNKVSGSIYILVAWIFSSMSLLLSSTIVQGYIGYSHLLYDSFGFGMILNILFLAFALVSRTKDIREQNVSIIGQEKAAIQNLTKLQAELKEVKAKLERKVDIQHVQIREKDKEIKKFSIKDELTSLYKKERLEELLLSELHRAKRYYDNLSIIVVNIDNMKSINDTHNFEVGNSVIKEMADVLANSIRYIDTVGRWTENEFLIICPETNKDQAIIASEHLIQNIAKNKFFFIGNSVTASFGVSSALAKDTEIDLINRAYEALALAKANGKNRVEAL